MRVPVSKTKVWKLSRFDIQCEPLDDTSICTSTEQETHTHKRKKEKEKIRYTLYLLAIFLIFSFFYFWKLLISLFFALNSLMSKTVNHMIIYVWLLSSMILRFSCKVTCIRTWLLYGYTHTHTAKHHITCPSTVNYNIGTVYFVQMHFLQTI